MKIGVFGLGSMGFGIAASLLRAGHQVCGADVDSARVIELQKLGAMKRKITEVAQQLDAVVLVVLNAAQADAVLFGEMGIVGGLTPGSVVMCCVTIAPDDARNFALRCEQSSVLYLDAPISGGSVKAAEGKLSIMASGAPAAFEKSRPILAAIAETVFELGDAVGAGSAMKAVNQMLAGTHIAAMAEALTFAMTQGIHPDLFLKVIPKCAGTSWMLENRAPHIAQGDYSPHSAINIWPKDLGIVLGIAGAANFSAPIAEAALQQFTAAAALGLGHEDDAAVAKVYARSSGLKLPGETE